MATYSDDLLKVPPHRSAVSNLTYLVCKCQYVLDYALSLPASQHFPKADVDDSIVTRAQSAVYVDVQYFCLRYPMQAFRARRAALCPASFELRVDCNASA